MRFYCRTCGFDFQMSYARYCPVCGIAVAPAVATSMDALIVEPVKVVRTLSNGEVEEELMSAYDAAIEQSVGPNHGTKVRSMHIEAGEIDMHSWTTSA